MTQNIQILIDLVYWPVALIALIALAAAFHAAWFTFTEDRDDDID